MSDQVLPPNEKLNSLNKQIIEIKKKIQLSEGQRKANFEECDTRKRESLNAIGRLKREVKELQLEFAKAKNNDEEIVRVANLNRTSSGYVKKRNLQEAKVTLEEDNTRLRKKLDLVKYQSTKRREKLSSLLEEYNKFLNEKPKKFRSTKLPKIPSQKKIIGLENQLHRVGIMQMEVDTIRKKYRSIRSSLKMDSSFYASCLDALEDDIRNQENEIKRLQKVKEEAIELRDATKENLVKQEAEEMRSAKDREIVIQEYRKCAEDQKMDLERLGRALFPTTKSGTRDDLDTNRNPKVEEDSDDILKTELNRLEEIFVTLRNATGVSKTEDVLDRFLTQQRTKEKLKKMQIITEQQKVTLEKTRQQLTTEIEMHKFSETKDADQNTEKLEKFNKEIEEQFCRQEKASLKLESFQILFKDAEQKLLALCKKLRKENEMKIPSEENLDTSNPLGALHELHGTIGDCVESFGGPEKFQELMDRILHDNIEVQSVGSKSEHTKVADDQPLFPLFPTIATLTAQFPASEDEDDIPSRSLMKRQAQLLVDAKSRRKGFTMKR